MPMATDAKTERKVRRTLHLRFTMPSADPSQLLSFVNASKPFYEMMGGTEVRLIQNVDDPGKFIQVIEYETPESMEVNRARIAGRYAAADLPAGVARDAAGRHRDRRVQGRGVALSFPSPACGRGWRTPKA